MFSLLWPDPPACCEQGRAQASQGSTSGTVSVSLPASCQIENWGWGVFLCVALPFVLQLLTLGRVGWAGISSVDSESQVGLKKGSPSLSTLA